MTRLRLRNNETKRTDAHVVSHPVGFFSPVKETTYTWLRIWEWQNMRLRHPQHL
jgi:hypothetical protein